MKPLQAIANLPEVVRSFVEAHPARTLQHRIAMLCALLVTITIAVVGIVSASLTSRSLYSQVDNDLIAMSGRMVGPIANDVPDMGGFDASALQATNITIALVKADHTVLTLPGQNPKITPGPQEIAIARLGFGSSQRTVRMGPQNQQYRLVAVPFQSADNNSYALLIARPLQPIITTFNKLQLIMFVLSICFILVGGVVGYIAGRALIYPLKELSDAVKRVAETDELTPIGSSRADELGDLSRSFDTMMQSLDSSRSRQKNLIADASHELRTPLTSMRTNVELLVADEKAGMLPAGARTEILGDVAAQLGEFTSLVGDLVQLSRDDVVMPSPEPLDLAKVVDAAVVRAKRRANGRLNFDVSTEPFFVVGEPDTLERAITNLLDNAVKFSPPDGTVHVNLVDDTLTISDEGPGIAEEDLPHVFDRFYRSNKARNTPGTGLGLSIVTHAINAHGGTVTAANMPDSGALFTVRLPAAPPEPEELVDAEA